MPSPAIHPSKALHEAGFLRDAGGLLRSQAEFIEVPGSAEALASLLAKASAAGRSVVVRGGGKTTEGESLARDDETLISTRGLRHFTGILNQEGLDYCRVGAGMTFDELERHLRPKGLELAVRPLSLSATLGGTVGIGGIDITSWRDGTMADQVLSMQVALPEGRLVECSPSEQSDLFEDVLYGYGQFGVVTELTLRLRPSMPVCLERRYFCSPGEAAEALVRAGREGLADQMAVLSFNGVVNALMLGFEDKERHRRFLESRRQWGFAEPVLWGRVALKTLNQPSLISVLPRLARLRSQLVGGLRDPLYSGQESLDFRAAAMSRLIWKVWGSRPLVIPDLSLPLDKMRQGVEKGLGLCQERFKLFSLYMVLVKRGAWQRRHVLGPFPRTEDPVVGGVEFEPLLEGDSWTPEGLQSFKEAIYNLGLGIGARAYRFGGGMGSYARRFCGEEEWQQFQERKKQWDPQGILNPRVFR
ncbi:MAG: FAD-binding oxidoreductase [Planctomycetota bacterium]